MRVQAATRSARRGAAARGRAARCRRRPRAPTRGRPRGSRSRATRRRTRCGARPAARRTRAARRRAGASSSGCAYSNSPSTRARIRLERRIERDDHRRRERQRLQPVDEVADRRPAASPSRIVGREVVPRRPRAARARQQRRVGVQHDAVGLVAHAREAAALERRRIGEERARLVAVAGEHDLVEALAATRRRVDVDAVAARGGRASPASRGGRRAARAAMRVDVLRAPPATVRHCGRSAIASRPWLWQKRTNDGSGKSRMSAPRRRPDRRGHRQQVPVAERRASSARVEVFAERDRPARRRRARMRGRRRD